MSYRERQRLADIQAAIDAIRSHPQRGDLTDGLNFDAVRIRLLETGEAVKALPDDLLATQQPSSPWRQIAPHMRDHLARRYFDTAANRVRFAGRGAEHQTAADPAARPGARRGKRPGAVLYDGDTILAPGRSHRLPTTY
jgi:uncharacterized protein with HEPN domain